MVSSAAKPKSEVADPEATGSDSFGAPTRFREQCRSPAKPTRSRAQQRTRRSHRGPGARSSAARHQIPGRWFQGCGNFRIGAEPPTNGAPRDAEEKKKEDPGVLPSDPPGIPAGKDPRRALTSGSTVRAPSDATRFPSCFDSETHRPPRSERRQRSEVVSGYELDAMFVKWKGRYPCSSNPSSVQARFLSFRGRWL